MLMLTLFGASSSVPFKDKIESHLATFDAELEGVSACAVAASINTTAAAIRAWRSLAVEHERARLETHWRLHGRFMPEDTVTVVRQWGNHKAASTTAWPTLFEPAFACPSVQRIVDPSIPISKDADDKFLCAVDRIRRPCKLLSLGSNFQDAFEEAMQCRSVIIDPTLDETKVSATVARDFAKRVESRGDILNRSVGIGIGAINVAGKALPLVSLRVLLSSLQQAPNRFFPMPRAHRTGAPCAKQPINPDGAHIDVLKVDIEGSEYDLLPEIFELCRQGLLSMDQLLVEVHSGSSSGKARHHAASLHAVFHGAHRCQLMLFHKNVNHVRAGRNSEFSWVSMRHVLRIGRAHMGSGGQEFQAASKGAKS